MKITTLAATLLPSLFHLTIADELSRRLMTPPVYKWMNLFPSNKLLKRQSGYHPEFGGCDYTGTTCEEACGGGYEECQASTDLALFCYDPTRGQICCTDDSGRACDKGFYCAKGAERTWCCPEGLSIDDCEALFQEGPFTSLGTEPLKTPSKPSNPSTTSAGGRGTPVGAETKTETKTETVTVNGGTTIRTTIFAPLTETLTETFTITVTGDIPEDDRTVTMTSVITIATTQTIVVGGTETTGAACTAGETCTTSGPAVVMTGKPPVVVTISGTARRRVDGLVLAVTGIFGLLSWA